ncbi:hypothetical protein M405DRAFT_840549 [Rhizopogon salebrosus TDB-379]|nr:hypothetical protein M405DRAFT_840549 [Rhizopogon salebrosus TDB-379]
MGDKLDKNKGRVALLQHSLRPTGLGYDELLCFCHGGHHLWHPLVLLLTPTHTHSHPHTLASSHHWHASLIKRKAIPPTPAKSHGRHQQCKSKHKFKNMGDKLDREKGCCTHPQLYTHPPTYLLPVALIGVNVKVTYWQQHEGFCAVALLALTSLRAIFSIKAN